MRDNRCYGELDHPADGKTKLTRASHRLTGLKLVDGSVVGEAKIMDTPNGRILKTILDDGGKVGVSSRGFGSTKKLADGTEEVQEDFRLQTFDFVADPAQRSAYPELFREEREKIARFEEANVDLDMNTLKKDYAGLVEEIQEETRQSLSEDLVTRESLNEEVGKAVTLAESRAESRLKERFSRELRRHVERLDEAAYDRARSDLLSDPEVAASRQIVEKIASLVTSFSAPHDVQEKLDHMAGELDDLKGKLAERELEIQAYTHKLEEMGAMARKAAYSLHLERSLRDDESRDTIAKLVGDVSQYENTEEMDERVDAIRSELANAKEEQTVDTSERDAMDKRFVELESRLASSEERAAKAEADVVAANSRTERAISVAEKNKVKAHVATESARFANASELVSLCESVNSVEKADAIIARHGKMSRFAGSLDESMARKIRERIARGQDHDASLETRAPARTKSTSSLMESIGISDEEFTRLAGI